MNTNVCTGRVDFTTFDGEFDYGNGTRRDGSMGTSQASQSAFSDCLRLSKKRKRQPSKLTAHKTSCVPVQLD
jgi:hypothetical protein